LVQRGQPQQVDIRNPGGSFFGADVGPFYMPITTNWLG
jgi:hypothetical protein